MAAPTSSAISLKKTLANTEPSTHGTKGTKRKSQRDVCNVVPSRRFARKFPVFAIKPTFKSTGNLVSSCVEFSDASRMPTEPCTPSAGVGEATMHEIAGGVR